MADGRRNNGGNSTKSNKLADNRNSTARNDLKKYRKEQALKVIEGLEKLRVIGFGGESKERLPALIKWLEYMVGKPEAMPEEDKKELEKEIKVTILNKSND